MANSTDLLQLRRPNTLRTCALSRKRSTGPIVKKNSVQLTHFCQYSNHRDTNTGNRWPMHHMITLSRRRTSIAIQTIGPLALLICKNIYFGQLVTHIANRRDIRPTARSIVQEQTFDIFRKEPSRSGSPAMNVENQLTARFSPSRRPNAQEVDFRGRSGEQTRTRRINETSPDFPFDQPGKIKL